jgi:hypothetical protein
MAKIKTHWEKTTPYGDYSLTKDRVNSRNERNLHVIRKARALGLVGKHAGSKPIDRLIQSIRTFEVNTDLHEKAKAARAA